MDEGEFAVYMAVTTSYQGHMLFVFANGKAAKVPMTAYATKTNRKKLVNAFSDKEELVGIAYLPTETEMAIRTSANRLLLVHSAQISEKQTKTTAGVQVITLKKNQKIVKVQRASNLQLEDAHRYRIRTLPASGALIKAEDSAQQLTMDL